MRKQSLAVMVVMALAFMLSIGCGVSLAQETGGGPGAGGNNERMGPPPGGDENQPPEGENGGRDGKMRPPKPPMPQVLYIGSAVKAENEFEMAVVNIFPGRGGDEDGSKLKKPAGVIEIAKKKYFIVEAKIETQEASLQLFPKEAKERGMKPPSVIKTLSAKISSTYFEMPQEPPAPGQADKMKMPEGTANIVGDINLASVEKEAGERQVLMVSGSVNTGEEKYSLYLEPRIIDMKPPRPDMQQRGGGPGQGGGMDRRGGKRPQPGSENDGGGGSQQNQQPE